MYVGVDEVDAELVDEIEPLTAVVELILEERDLERVDAPQELSHTAGDEVSEGREQ